MTSFKHLVTNCLVLLALAACTSKKDVQKETPTALPFSDISLNNLDEFKTDGKNWSIQGNVFMDRSQEGGATLQEGKGVLVNRPGNGGNSNLFTKMEQGDIDLHLDFMLSRGARTAVYFEGRYAVLLSDSWRKDSAEAMDCGALLTAGSAAAKAPLINACKAPGLWQHLYVRFKAPQFDSAGKKISNVLFEEVIINGKLVQQHVEVTAPVQGAAFTDEKNTGPLMFANSKGPVAFRNIQNKVYKYERIALTGMQFDEYSGNYKNYDTLKNLKPVKSGHTDTLSYRLINKKNQLVIKGNMAVPRDGEYLFKLNAAGPAWLFIDDKAVLDNDSTGDWTLPYYERVHLIAGNHEFKVIFSNLYESLTLGYEGPNIPFTVVTTESSERKADYIPPMEYKLKNEPAYQRGFLMHQGKVDPYAISVGIPGGMNYAYDLSTYNLLSAWRGRYIDVSNMWEERGEAQREEPLGAPVEFAGKPSLLQLSGTSDVWPDTVDVINNAYTHRGYKIQDNGLPVFMYTYQNATVEDEITPLPDKSGLMRKVSIRFQQPAKEVYFLLGSGKLVEKLPNGAYGIDDKQYYIESLTGADAIKLKIEQAKDDTNELLLPLSANANQTVTFSYSIIW